jgi:hypothetical protein
LGFAAPEPSKEVGGVEAAEDELERVGDADDATDDNCVDKVEIGAVVVEASVADSHSS